MIKFENKTNRRRTKSGKVWCLNKKNKLQRSYMYSGITTFDGYWWSEPMQKWVKNIEGGFSSHFEKCHSIRAFRRRLRQWSMYLPKGIKFILVSQFKGQDVYGTTT